MDKIRKYGIKTEILINYLFYGNVEYHNIEIIWNYRGNIHFTKIRRFFNTGACTENVLIFLPIPHTGPFARSNSAKPGSPLTAGAPAPVASTEEVISLLLQQQAPLAPPAHQPATASTSSPAPLDFSSSDPRFRDNSSSGGGFKS